MTTRASPIAAEETRNPERDLAIGIIGSMLACAAIYTAIAAVALFISLPQQTHLWFHARQVVGIVLHAL